MRKRRGNCHGHLLGLLGFPLGLPAKAPRPATEADESTPTPVGEVEEAVGHIVAGQSFFGSLTIPVPRFWVPSLADDVLEPPSSTALLLSYYQNPQKRLWSEAQTQKESQDLPPDCHFRAQMM